MFATDKEKALREFQSIQKDILSQIPEDFDIEELSESSIDKGYRLDLQTEHSGKDTMVSRLVDRTVYISIIYEYGTMKYRVRDSKIFSTYINKTFTNQRNFLNQLQRNLMDVRGKILNKEELIKKRLEKENAISNFIDAHLSMATGYLGNYEVRANRKDEKIITTEKYGDVRVTADLTLEVLLFAPDQTSFRRWRQPSLRLVPFSKYMDRMQEAMEIEQSESRDLELMRRQIRGEKQDENQ